MRVPSIPYRDPPAAEERDDRVLLALFGASLLMSALIWGLAIAKAIDFYASS